MYMDFWNDISVSFASDAEYCIQNTRVLIYNG